MKTAVICFLFCLVANHVVAQTEQPSSGGAAATGIVVGPNGQPEVGVPLKVEGPQGKTLAVTDEKGKWSLYNLAPGSYKVEIVGKGRRSTTNFDVKPTPWYSKDSPAVYRAPEIKLPEIKPPEIKLER